MSTAGIVTYPLEGTTYDAEDAAAYFSTRTSGVYSTDEDFAVAPAGGTSVTVSAGRAWMHPSRWAGISVTAREDTTLALPQADSYLPRIDRIVLRYDATSRTTTLQVLQGAAGSSPTAPDISRTEMVYDLCLAEVARPAGQTSLTTADITDTRADAALCGLMRDGVTGIPMEGLGAQALAKAEETARVCDALLKSYNGGYLGVWTVTLSASGWAKTADMPGYGYKQTVQLRAARASSIPSAVPDPGSYTVAVSAGLAGVCETGNGTITFWAENVPEGGIQMQVSLLGPTSISMDIQPITDEGLKNLLK